MLVVYCPPRFPIFLCDDDHGVTSIGRSTSWYRSNDASFDIFSKGLSDLFLVVVEYWNGVISDFMVGGAGEPSLK